MITRTRPLFVAALAVASLLTSTLHAVDAPASQPAAGGFSNALPLTKPGAPTTVPANLDKLILKDVVIPEPPKTEKADDEALVAAAKAYRTIFNNAREAGARPMADDLGGYVDTVLAKWDLTKLSNEQYTQLINSIPLILSKTSKTAVEGVLAEQAKASTADGAQAAILRLAFIPQGTKAEDRAARVNEVLDHPGLVSAVAAGKGAALFNTASSLEPDALTATAGKINALAASITHDAPINFFRSASSFVLNAQGTLIEANKTDNLKVFEPFRAAVATAAGERLKSGSSSLSEEEKTGLELAVAQLNGAFAKAEFIGHPAPPIEFTAYTDPSDPSKKITSLADLKGKVVLVDFWATWCGPCKAAFPKLKAVQNYYKGYDVVVLGVTSPQGYVIVNKSRVDTEGDPAKEAQLTFNDVAKELEMTWPLAMSRTNVFDPNYGITGIPCFVVIDAQGKVRSRHVGFNPNESIDVKIGLIDPLLAEAKLPLPARMMMSKPETGG